MFSSLGSGTAPADLLGKWPFSDPGTRGTYLAWHPLGIGTAWYSGDRVLEKMCESYAVDKKKNKTSLCRNPHPPEKKKESGIQLKKCNVNAGNRRRRKNSERNSCSSLKTF